MRCPFCGEDEDKVNDSRTSKDGREIRRRRECLRCERRFTTYERVGSPGLRVEKRDGDVEPFDSDKLTRALERITRHRPALRPDDLRRVARDVEAALIDTGQRTTSWARIARLVLDRLTPIDRVAAERLRVNYLDDDGRLRLEDAEPPGQEPPQLGLFEGEVVVDPARPAE